MIYKTYNTKAYKKNKFFTTMLCKDCLIADGSQVSNRCSNFPTYSLFWKNTPNNKHASNSLRKDIYVYHKYKFNQKSICTLTKNKYHHNK